jgi:hypothetical protein
MWLVKLCWANVRTSLRWPPENAPIHDTTASIGGQFTAFGRRQGFDCYLFINRSEAEIFKQTLEDRQDRNGPRRCKPQTQLVEVTPEDVAHLDLDPVKRKDGAGAPQI